MGRLAEIVKDIEKHANIRTVAAVVIAIILLILLFGRLSVIIFLLIAILIIIIISKPLSEEDIGKDETTKNETESEESANKTNPNGGENGNGASTESDEGTKLTTYPEDDSFLYDRDWTERYRKSRIQSGKRSNKSVANFPPRKQYVIYDSRTSDQRMGRFHAQQQLHNDFAKRTPSGIYATVEPIPRLIN